MPAGQKPLIAETVSGQPRQRQRIQHRRRAGGTGNRKAAGYRTPDNSKPRIVDRGHPGIRNHKYSCAFLHTVQKRICLAALVMVMVCNNLPANAHTHTVSQIIQPAGVLRRNNIRILYKGCKPVRGVGSVSYRRSSKHYFTAHLFKHFAGTASLAGYAAGAMPAGNRATCRLGIIIHAWPICFGHTSNLSLCLAAGKPAEYPLHYPQQRSGAAESATRLCDRHEAA